MKILKALLVAVMLTVASVASAATIEEFNAVVKNMTDISPAPIKVKVSEEAFTAYIFLDKEWWSQKHVIVFNPKFIEILSVDEVAAVLGHEIGHVVEHAGVTAWTNQKLVGIDDYQMEEIRADLEGIFLANEAGYDPRAALTTMMHFNVHHRDLLARIGTMVLFYSDVLISQE